MNRLEQNHRIAALLDPADFLPAVGQGALAIECAIDRPDVIEAVAPLMHHPTLPRDHRRARVLARARREAATRRSRATPMFRDGELWLRGLLANRDGTDVMRGERSVALDADAGDVAVADELGRELAEEFKSRGAARAASTAS